MDSECANLEERLKSLLFQLQTESGILERIVHKGKNQHRRCPYFKSLIQVRRDLRLLQSTELGEILNTLFPIIKGATPTRQALLPNRNKNKNAGGKLNYHNRLLGVARLLSQMAEPILKAATQISLLLAKSFFMGFSVTVLALLARLRVLVQQVLLDVVSIFNKVSGLLQKHSLKLCGGVEAFVEYYSTTGDVLTLECIWEHDKYVLHERTQVHSLKRQEKEGAFPIDTPVIYQTVELFGKGSCSDNENLRMQVSDNDARTPANPSYQPVSISNDTNTDFTSSLNSETQGNPLADQESLTSLNHGSQSKSRKRVAFVAVQRSNLIETDQSQPDKKMRVDLQSHPVNAATAVPDDHPFSDLPFCRSIDRTLF